MISELARVRYSGCGNHTRDDAANPSIRNLSLFLVDLAEERFTEDWIESINCAGVVLRVSQYNTSAPIDELRDGVVAAPVVVVGVKNEVSSASANDLCFAVRSDGCDVDISCKSTCTVELEDLPDAADWMFDCSAEKNGWLIW